MRVIKPKILGTLEIKIALAGNYFVTNGVRKPPNKISIPCESYEEAVEIIDRLKNAKVGDVLHF